MISGVLLGVVFPVKFMTFVDELGTMRAGTLALFPLVGVVDCFGLLLVRPELVVVARGGIGGPRREFFPEGCAF